MLMEEGRLCLLVEEGRLCLLVDQLLVPLLANQKNCLGVSSVMKTPLSGALDAVETFTVQPAVKSSMSVKIQMNTGWKNLRNDIKRPIFCPVWTPHATMICHPGNKRDMYPSHGQKDFQSP